MTRLARCGLIQMGIATPMSEPVATIVAATNANAARLIGEAAAQGVQIAVLPELFNVPYVGRFTDARWYAAAEPIPDGPTITLMRRLARQHQMVIVAPIYEQAGGKRYNTAAVIDANGDCLGVYRKHHVPTYHTGNYEPFYFHQPNVGFPVFDTAYARIGVSICYDRHFPEVARIYGVKNVEILFNASATGGPNSERVWELEQQAHALNNGYYVGALNRVGQGEPFDVGKFFGKSYFCDPFGQIVAQGGRGTEEIVVADLDLGDLPRIREEWHTNRLFIDRRPSTYHEMFTEPVLAAPPAIPVNRAERPVAASLPTLAVGADLPTTLPGANQPSANQQERGNMTNAHPNLRYKPIITQEMKDAAVRALEGGKMIRSAMEKDSDGGRFEDEFAAYLGVKHGVAVSSGFAALHVAVMAAGIGPGDEVITESRTFISVGDVIALVGAKPVFVDIDRDTVNIDPALIEAAITERTRAIMPVHNNGLTCEMGPIEAIARKHGLKLIVDSCQSIGTHYKGSKRATVGDIGAFSFIRNKSMTCGGEGGMVMTDDDELAYRAMLLANHGRGRDYFETHNTEVIGYNYRLSEVLAAIGRVQLKHVDDWNHQRRTNTAVYQELFAERQLPVTISTEPDWGYHTRMRCVILAPQRDELVRYLRAQDIQASPEYPLPIHLNKPYIERFGFRRGQFPVSEQVAAETIVLPNWPGIVRADLEFVADHIATFYRDHA